MYNEKEFNDLLQSLGQEVTIQTLEDATNDNSKFNSYEEVKDDLLKHLHAKKTRRTRKRWMAVAASLAAAFALSFTTYAVVKHLIMQEKLAENGAYELTKPLLIIW